MLMAIQAKVIKKSWHLVFGLNVIIPAQLHFVNSGLQKFSREDSHRGKTPTVNFPFNHHHDKILSVSYLLLFTSLMRDFSDEDDWWRGWCWGLSSLLRVSRRGRGRLVASEQHSGGRVGLDVCSVTPVMGLDGNRHTCKDSTTPQIILLRLEYLHLSQSVVYLATCRFPRGKHVIQWRLSKNYWAPQCIIIRFVTTLTIPLLGLEKSFGSEIPGSKHYYTKTT
jgi:hypothetical protein